MAELCTRLVGEDMETSGMVTLAIFTFPRELKVWRDRWSRILYVVGVTLLHLLIRADSGLSVGANTVSLGTVITSITGHQKFCQSLLVVPSLRQLEDGVTCALLQDHQGRSTHGDGINSVNSVLDRLRTQMLHERWLLGQIVYL